MEEVAGSKAPFHYVIVLTKSDKLRQRDIEPAMKRTIKAMHNAGMDVPIVLSSSTKREGAKEIWEALADGVEALRQET